MWISGTLWSHSLAVGRVANPWIHATRSRGYHTEFGRARSNGLGVWRGWATNFGGAGAPPLLKGFVSDLLEIFLSHTYFTTPNLVALAQTARAYMRWHSNNSAPQIQLWCWHCAPYKCLYYYYYYCDLSRPAFRGHSKSSKVTCIDWWLMTSY